MLLLELQAFLSISISGTVWESTVLYKLELHLLYKSLFLWEKAVSVKVQCVHKPYVFGKATKLNFVIDITANKMWLFFIA